MNIVSLIIFTRLGRHYGSTQGFLWKFINLWVSQVSSAEQICIVLVMCITVITLLDHCILHQYTVSL
ncbi:hypothetical protein METBIDRAFT_152952 [Metschnikowia bicuspidata var. bicuspidata NRRL YB-4993]|uniref:Uncharacterized protein n=1 Tax=Metschnikowia bicuspidata var. bicuspidata NRRL YB-4993 TaxID=869754 RepID=A0A1A0HET2_9ASCO|nr:hypothetical protein METBIDRAFT_152952 [Metschnikowia bicuspidata var. bicuspidata NRRL YB-4993]OBA22397.1 hypothetical protein METBIDRAFT_152952 [Metschnikowia bicuspidata var. bicuspidata NRRL YB-4993]